MPAVSKKQVMAMRIAEHEQMHDSVSTKFGSGKQKEFNKQRHPEVKGKKWVHNKK